MPFEDIEAERIIISGILRHGRDAFIDADELVFADAMTDDTNRLIYACAADHFGAGEERPLDHATLMSLARTKKIDHILCQEDERKYIRGLYNYAKNVDIQSVRPAAAKLLKLHVGRELDDKLRQSRIDLQKITGDEALALILSIAEKPILEYAQSVSDDRLNSSTHIAAGGKEWLEEILANPREHVGIPLPFAKWNEQVGGGCRVGGVTVFAARPKQGKSSLSNEVCMFVAKSGTFVLNVDTEMSPEEQQARILAHETGIKINDIEKGCVNEEEKADLRRAMDDLERLPYHYKSVVDLSFEEQLAMMRRWIVKNVPIGEVGRREKALIVYDYLQVSDASEFKGDFKEYQMLGFQMMALIRLASKYQVAVLSLLQLNREGDEKESTTVAAGSDRIIWKCSSFTILKKKTEEEIEHDGPENGNRKLLCLIARHGPGADGNYISLDFDGATCRMKETKTKFEIYKERGSRTSEEKTFASKKSTRKLKKPKVEQFPDALEVEPQSL